MARSKLTWEYGDNRDIVINKSKGKITFQELQDFLQTPEMLNIFEGALFSWFFRPYSFRYDDFEIEEPEGDQVVLVLSDDGSYCPICARNDLVLQYCPDCGAKLMQPINRKPT